MTSRKSKRRPAWADRGRGDGVYVVAEAGVNHNGDVDAALRMVDVAAEAGADAVKFQTFRPEELVTRNAPKAAYQKISTDADQSQLSMLEALVLDESNHKTLLARCRERSIDFLSTPFDVPSLRLLADTLGLETIKIPSGEITNGPLLLAAAECGTDIILSTGMSSLEDVEQALAVLAFGFTGNGQAPSQDSFRRAFAEEDGQAALRQMVVVLHCTTEYPAPYAEINLRAMEALRQYFSLSVGLSDHSLGLAVPVAAAALGARVIEKHFTLDRSLPGPDHQASLEPDELASMVAAVRQIELALGDGVKEPTPSERKNVTVARKSLVARRDIHKGERFTPENLGVKRPGTGASPMDYWTWVGRQATRDYTADELIVP